MKITAIILTFNEEIHLKRCLERLHGVVTHFLVVDSYSTDNTIAIAEKAGAKVLQYEWVNYATSFDWALSQVDSDSDWVMRIDADEYLSEEFIYDIQTRLPKLDQNISGVYCRLRRVFQGKMIRFGAVSVKMLRLWRYGHGSMESRFMDEHVSLNGDAISFNGYIIDHNLNSLSWWTAKHNSYSAREVVDILNLEYKFLDSVAKLNIKSPFGLKRWIKEHLYANLPGGVRALAYFIYRYFFALGFLDGQAGFTFHFLQGFWYRFLVDMKLAEVRRFMKESNCDVSVAIEKILAIKIVQHEIE